VFVGHGVCVFTPCQLLDELEQVIEGNELQNLKGFAKWMLSWEGVKMLGDGNIG
jgi:hypothetical protein